MPKGIYPRKPGTQIGERNANHKLTLAQVREILRRRAAGQPARHIAQAFGTHPSNVRMICRGARWAGL
jgi:transcriptional regulator